LICNTVNRKKNLQRHLADLSECKEVWTWKFGLETGRQ
jgi:hypothetical protein